MMGSAFAANLSAASLLAAAPSLAARACFGPPSFFPRSYLASVREHERAVLLVEVLIEAKPGRRASDEMIGFTGPAPDEAIGGRADRRCEC
jgi:hypothetical protein